MFSASTCEKCCPFIRLDFSFFAGISVSRGRGDVLTLNVDCDTGLLAVGDRLVGRLTDDLLTRLNVGR